jgi:predicted nucleic acid-binding protein
MRLSYIADGSTGKTCTEMTDDNPIFVDTNILLAATDTSLSDHQQAFALINSHEKILAANGQVLREYMDVATSSLESNGFGMNPKDVCNNITQFRLRIILLEESPSVSRILQRLVEQYSLKGKRIHDANIAATMLAYGLTTLATLNPRDFQLFEGLSIISL